MKLKLSFPVFMLIIVIGLALSACQSETPTAEIHQSDTVEEEPLEKESMKVESIAGTAVPFLLMKAV